MTRFITGWLPRSVAGLLVLLLALPVPARGQDAAAPPPFKPEELEQLAAPIALYPDPLVAQILMASTYPLEVVQASRFVKANANLKGAQLDEALKKHDWDNSVKALVHVPQVLAMMDEKIDWTQKLGDAFLDQPKELMDATQRLRQKAKDQGNLKDTKEQKVIVEQAPPLPAGQPAQQTTVIKIEPADPQVVYVPTYNPTVVYGAWPYPAYPPYYYYPPGYALAGAAFGFAAGVAVGAAWGWGGCNWGGGDVDVNVNKSNTFNNNVNRGDVANKRAERQGQSSKFQHNPENRKGTQYRNQATQQKFDKAGPANAQSRDQFRGRAEQGRQDTGRGGADQGRGGGPGGDRAGQRPGGGAGGDIGQSRGGQGGAFDGAGRGGDVRSSSERGSASRGSMSAGAGSAGGGRPSSMQSGGGSRGGSSGFSGGGGGSRGGGGGGGGRGGGGGGRGGRR
jgi:hypothetical protein